MWKDVELPDGAAYTAAWSIADTGSLSPFSNAYGDLRSPWNNNPSTHISRCNTTYGVSKEVLPSCDVMETCYESSSLSAVRTHTMMRTHIHIHFTHTHTNI
jgi:hypothetical protein